MPKICTNPKKYSRRSQYRLLQRKREILNYLSSEESDSDSEKINRQQNEEHVQSKIIKKSYHPKLSKNFVEKLINNSSSSRDESMMLHNSATSLHEINNRSTDSSSNTDGSESESDVTSLIHDFNFNVDNSDSESSRDSDNYEDNNDMNSKGLYPGAPITVGESMLLTLSMYLRHDMSDSLLSDMLEWLELHCPQPNHCAKSLYLFRKWLKKFETPLTRHYFCPICLKKLSNVDERCSECSDSKSSSYFIEIPIVSQLQDMFNRPGFHTSLNHRFTRVKKNENNVEDIYDGSIYHGYLNNNNIFDLNCPSNISFTWNSDGISLFKSSKMEVWPVFFQINELPIHERNKVDNLILVGLWFGVKKPYPNLFMDAFIPQLSQLYNGVTMHVKDLDREITLKALVTHGTLDLPAKALYLSMKQYNGKNGCHKCTIETIKIINTRVYSTVDNLHLRTSSEMLAISRKASKKKPILGVMGPTIISKIVPDYIISTKIDPMHLVMGLVKTLLGFWISPSFHEHPASMSEYAKVIDDRLSSMRVPLFVERIPRVTEDFNYWKAWELIMFLMYYSIPILSDIMQQEYLNHHKLLVLGLYLLSQESISKNDINDAYISLKKYVTDFKTLYGEQYMTCNLHSLLHLPDSVKECGNLWLISCFPFENANGILRKLVHATRDAQIQMCRSVSLYMMLGSLTDSLMLQDSRAKVFCKKLKTKGTHRLKLNYIGNGIGVAGTLKKLKLLDPDIRELLVGTGNNFNNVYSFHRLFKNGKIYTTQPYSSSKRTNSSCVSFVDGDEESVGIIHQFIRLSNCPCKTGICANCSNTASTYAIVKKYKYDNMFTTEDPERTLFFINMLDLDFNGPFRAINVSDLEMVYFLITIEKGNKKKLYAVRPMNFIM